MLCLLGAHQLPAQLAQLVVHLLALELALFAAVGAGPGRLLLGLLAVLAFVLELRLERLPVAPFLAQSALHRLEALALLLALGG